MKYLFSLLALLISTSLVASLNRQKVQEALVASHVHRPHNVLCYSLNQDPDQKAIVEEINLNSSDKVSSPYELSLQGLEPGTHFDLYLFNLLGVQDPNLACSGYIDKSGKAWAKQKEGPLPISSMHQFMGGTLPGEPIYALVVVGKQDKYIAAHCTPNPLEAYGESGRHVSMEFFSLKAPKYLIFGDHFEPEEKVYLTFNSRGGKVKKFAIANEKGMFSTLLEGKDIEDLSMKNSVQITSAYQSDPMTIVYDWQFLGAPPSR